LRPRFSGVPTGPSSERERSLRRARASSELAWSGAGRPAGVPALLPRSNMERARTPSTSRAVANWLGARLSTAWRVRASTVPGEIRANRRPREVSLSTARRESSGCGLRRIRPRSESRRRTPVRELGCRCITLASSPADIPGTCSITRSDRNWGPVVPRRRCMSREVRAKAWSTSQSERKKVRTGSSRSTCSSATGSSWRTLLAGALRATCCLLPEMGTTAFSGSEVRSPLRAPSASLSPLAYDPSS
jgi:hypothetical protein